jgi:hypothetical protein
MISELQAQKIATAAGGLSAHSGRTGNRTANRQSRRVETLQLAEKKSRFDSNRQNSGNPRIEKIACRNALTSRKF